MHIIYSPGTSEARQRVVDRGNGEDNEVDNGGFTRPFGRVKSTIVDLIVLSNSMVEHELESRRYGVIQAVIHTLSREHQIGRKFLIYMGLWYNSSVETP